MSADLLINDENSQTIADMRKSWQLIEVVNEDGQGTIKEWLTPSGTFLEVLNAEGKTEQLVKVDKRLPEGEIISFIKSYLDE